MKGGLKFSAMEKIKVMLVDDEEVDFINVKRAFKKNNLDHTLEYQSNGLDAIKHLRSIQNPIDLPQVVLLDINMPKMNGHEFLTEVRADTRLKHIVVYVLTTSSQNRDIDKAYQNQVSGYFIKPLDYEEFKLIVKKLDELWKVQRFPDFN